MTTTTTTPPATQADQDAPPTGADGQQQPATSPQDAPQDAPQDDQGGRDGQQDQDNQQQDQDGQQDDGQRESGPGAEAARYRRQLRAAEADLETVRGQLEAAQRRDVERAVGDLLAVPGDVIDIAGHELVEFVRDDGSVDVEMVRGAAAVLVGTRPGLGKVEPRPIAPPNHGAGFRGPTTAAPAGWGDVLRS